MKKNISRSMGEFSQGKARLSSFTRLSGHNWLKGRYLLPVLKVIADKTQGNILDIGAGDQWFASFLDPHKHNYIAMDTSSRFRVHIVGEATHLPLKNECIDLCVLFYVLGDIFNVSFCFAEVARVLRSQGRCLILETLGYPEHDLPHDYWRFTKGCIAELGRPVGLTVQKVWPLGGFWEYLASLICGFLLYGASGKKGLGAVAKTGMIITNIISYALDRCIPLSRGGESHLTLLVKDGKV